MNNALLQQLCKLGLAFASVFAITLQGAEITTTFSGSSVPAAGALLHARQISGNSPALSLPIKALGTSHLSLPEGLWEVRVVGEGLFSSPVQLRDIDAATIRVWQTAPLDIRSTAARSLRADFRSVHSDGPAGEVDCAHHHDLWTCWIPDGRYDIRFTSKESAPEYLFAITVPAKPDAAELRLNFVPGASLYGRLESARGRKISPEGVKVSLEASGGEGARPPSVTSADARGFFQFKGLSPGEYLVTATRPGLAAQSRMVSILDGREAVLNAPLLLDTPKTLRVTVNPSIDSAGARWEVRLLAVDARQRRATVLASSQASRKGEWSAGGLVAGEYTLEVLRSDGPLWKSQPVFIEREDSTITVAADAGRVQGEVTLGNEPLQATLTFDAEGGPMIRSDSSGRAVGEIPPDGRNERVILVEADAPQVKRSVLTKMELTEGGEMRFKISLPSTSLAGRVVNDDRSVAPNAVLTVTRDDPDVFEQSFTRSDGSFEIAGLEAGRYRVTANAFERASKPLSIDLTDEPTEVELVLLRHEKLQGRMTSGEVPVISADIYALPRDGWSPLAPRARTNEHGAFYIELPPGTTTYDGIAVHPSFDIVIGRGVVKSDRSVRIRTQQIGGTLVVQSDAAEGLLLRHNGGEVALPWISHLAGGTAIDGKVAVPRLEPGHYSLCRKGSPECVSGYLPPHGTLTLEPK